ncbi:GatB/YqeY domain-containing protein [Patescibacteria group bacterium]
MSLLNKILKDLATAMKEQDADKVSVLRMVKAALQNVQIGSQQVPSSSK